MPNQATISVNVIQFNGVNDMTNPAKLCILDPKKPVVITDSLNGRIYQIPGSPTIKVTKGGAFDMVFSVYGPNNTTPWFVAGVAFNFTTGLSSPPGQGNNNFDLGTINLNQLTITNKCKVKPAYWDFMIAIGDGDGLVGIIDPGVENES
jgi:hypothetical protein